MSISDSDYEYMSDSDVEMMSNSSYEEEEDNYTMYPLAVINNQVPIDTMQYEWTVFCQRLNATHLESEYDMDNNLVIKFHVGDHVMELSVLDTPNKALWYPNVPPSIAISGPSFMIDDELLITHNDMLCKSSWNICVDVNAFICQAMDILRNTSAESDAYSEVNRMIRKCATMSGTTFSFVSRSVLPAFGAMTVGSSGGYASSGMKLVEYGSLADALINELTYIASITHELSFRHICILARIIKNILSVKLSNLEVMQNEDYYNTILSIIRYTDMDVDTSELIAMMNANHTEVQCDKVFFVESFSDHTLYDRNAAPPTGKLTKRIHAEIGALEDTLKDVDCYVCISESNIQYWKMLMIPDYDTPYGGGYFEFDMFIPAGYPHAPPKVKFLTTGGGTVRFNPNLYNCGKVCLSILNTWSTNQWMPSSSTISQVLLSIFSMIFVEHPYTNEPAYYEALETDNGRMQSKKYNDKVLVNCARVAITGQLTNTSTPFVDIIKSHWAINKEKTVEAYAKHGITIHE